MKKTKKEVEKIEETFTNIIREEMTEKQFWKWVSEWFDVDEIITAAENWNIEDKIDLIKDFNKK